MRFLWIFFLTIGLAQSAQNRVALIIGNASYSLSPLTNPVNDARAMDAKLRALGFKTVLRENLTQKQIGSALREFRANLSPGAEALFFYAGHGLQIKGVNYLPAVDADISAEEDVPTQSIDVNKVLEIMEESKTRINLIFLDACRNNPYSRRFRSQNGGLAKISAPSGTIISFATRPGSVAADGEGSNGLYTEHLLKAMDEPGIPIEQVLKKVLIAVKKASRGKQEPWLEGGIEGEFYFIGVARIKPQSTSPPATATVDPAAIELSFWDSIKTSKDRGDFEEYLRQYPQGRFAGLARNRLKSPTAATPAKIEKQKPTSEPAKKPTNMASDLTPFWQDRLNNTSPTETQKQASNTESATKTTATASYNPMINKVHSSEKTSNNQVTPANDEKLAASLVGKWEGAWKTSDTSRGGKMNMNVSASEGANLKGRADWISTSAGDLELDFIIAKLSNSKLSIAHNGGLAFDATISSDGKTMSGTWINRHGNTGTLQLKKIN